MAAYLDTKGLEGQSSEGLSNLFVAVPRRLEFWTLLPEPRLLICAGFPGIRSPAEAKQLALAGRGW
jgi:hypothetical protein